MREHVVEAFDRPNPSGGSFGGHVHEEHNIFRR